MNIGRIYWPRFKLLIIEVQMVACVGLTGCPDSIVRDNEHMREHLPVIREEGPSTL